MENHELTEAHKKVIQETVLNEFLGYFQNHAQKFAAQKGNARVSITAAKAGHVYRNPSVFPGEIYSNKTRLPPKKWSLFRSKAPVPTRGNLLVKSFNLIFIIGYQLDLGGIFYEIWYDSYDGTYIILDKFALPVSSHFKNLDDAVADFIDIIAEENPSIHKSELSSRESGIIKNLARRGKISNESEDQKAESMLVEQLLEMSGITRHMLTAAINDKVTEYHATRMDSVATKKFWQFWGKYVQIPQKYISRGFIGALQKFVGKAKTATFIIGFALRDQIDVEIWYVRDNVSGRGSYYVFDLTSAEIVAQDIKTVRGAYTEAARKLLIPTDLLGKVE